MGLANYPNELELPLTLAEFSKLTLNQINPILTFYQIPRQGNRQERLKALGKRLEIKKYLTILGQRNPNPLFTLFNYLCINFEFF